jgi:1,4-alpha-glucan branching enzyme
MKWDMGWMHDSLRYFSKDPIHRKYHHNDLTFRMMYAFSENFVLPISHDEVVHGKGSLLGKMPGDEWRKFANLRLLFSHMYAQPGKKLLFMGCDVAQRAEWNHDSSVEWHLLQYAPHRGVRDLVRDLNRLYRDQPALHELDCDSHGCEWIDCNDSDHSTLSFLRRSAGGEVAVVACNFTPQPRRNYRVGVPHDGYWRELLNSDSEIYGGSNLGNGGGVQAAAAPHHGRPFSLSITLPPLALVVFKA